MRRFGAESDGKRVPAKKRAVAVHGVTTARGVRNKNQTGSARNDDERRGFAAVRRSRGPRKTSNKYQWTRIVSPIGVYRPPRPAVITRPPPDPSGANEDLPSPRTRARRSVNVPRFSRKSFPDKVHSGRR